MTDLVQTGANVLEAIPLRRIWLTLEGPDIIELKQVMLDRDVEGIAAFFRRVVVPQVRQTAEHRWLILDVSSQELEEC